MGITQRLEGLGGKIGFFYKNLVTGEEISHNPDMVFVPASVMKLFVLTEAFRRFEEGTLDRNEFVTVPREKCFPSCGAITYLHDNFSLTIHDMCVLMIILSDNTATNMLIDILGTDNINATMNGCGLSNSRVNRKLWDLEKEAQGIQNAASPRDCASWLEMVYKGEMVSKAASRQMLEILKNQRLNGKIPFYIHSLKNAVPIAHKTGEETGTTHDVGIVFADKPFIVCFMGNETEVPVFERVMAEISLDLFNQNMN